MLKDLGIGIIFEKENINTLDAKGEVLLTILSSLAQDESRSISENCTWGIRRRFETGKHKMSTKRFLGYDTDETGNQQDAGTDCGSAVSGIHGRKNNRLHQEDL